MPAAPEVISSELLEKVNHLQVSVQLVYQHFTLMHNFTRTLIFPRANLYALAHFHVSNHFLKVLVTTHTLPNAFVYHRSNLTRACVIEVISCNAFYPFQDILGSEDEKIPLLDILFRMNSIQGLAYHSVHKRIRYATFYIIFIVSFLSIVLCICSLM